MTDPTRPDCPDCGSALGDDALCPACLMRMALETTAGPAPNVSESPNFGPIRYFGDYEIVREVARGGMGIVYEARQTSLNRPVALKMILSGALAGEEDVRRFRREAEAAAGLDHPGIVPIFEVGEHQNQHYFSMAFIEGPSLAHEVAAGPLPPGRAAEIVWRIAEAVQFAHDRGVIHRDLKPANVLIDARGRPRVTDFGLAKTVRQDSGLTATGQVMGTPSFMPPEQAAGKPVGPPADVYSLGAILYQLLTGRPPFHAAGPMETLLQVMEREAVPPRQLNPSVPKDLETVALKCLEKIPTRRYASARSLADDLARWIEGRPVLARPVGRMGRAVRWCRRNPAMAALGATAASLLIATAAASTTGYVLTTKALGEVKTEKAAARERLRDSLLSGAKSARLLGDPWAARASVIEAAKIRPGMDLRREAAQSLVTPGVRLVREIVFGNVYRLRFPEKSVLVEGWRVGNPARDAHTLAVFRAEDGQEVGQFLDAASAMTAQEPALAPGTSIVAYEAVAEGRTIRVRDVVSGRNLGEYPGFDRPKFGPDGSWLVLTTENNFHGLRAVRVKKDRADQVRPSGDFVGFLGPRRP